jgi:hypothetical protein
MTSGSDTKLSCSINLEEYRLRAGLGETDERKLPGVVLKVYGKLQETVCSR